MNNVLLVSEKKIKSFTSLDPNMDFEELKPFVKVSQDITLQRIIGTKFLNELYNQVINNTLTQVNKDLLNNYITDILIYDAVYRVLPSIHLKVKQQGIIRSDGDTFITTGLNDMKYVRNEYENLVNFYTERLVDHLCHNEKLYPLYTKVSTDGSINPKKRGTYNSGIALPKSRIKRDWKHAPNSNDED